MKFKNQMEKSERFWRTSVFFDITKFSFGHLGHLLIFFQVGRRRLLNRRKSEVTLKAAKSRSADTPFAREARGEFYDFDGGKLDDITIVVDNPDLLFLKRIWKNSVDQKIRACTKELLISLS